MLPENWSELDADSRNNYLRQTLKEDHQVTFTKLDGSVRVMPCTLRDDAIPQRAVTEHHQTRVYKPETLSVWCLDKAEWRAFKVMNVTDIRKL